jgi:hypothetical protein
MAGLAIAPVPVRASGVPVVLRGSSASMVRQNRIARQLGYKFARTPRELRALTQAGNLVRLSPNGDFGIAELVGNRVARAELRTFIERLAAQYHDATGERLVVTSLTRPMSRQPDNAHPLSVHPAGIAVDLRVPARAKSRRWLERTLLSLEREGLLDVTREYRPPHYHVALFPSTYLAYLNRLAAEEKAVADAEAAAVAAAQRPLHVQAATTPQFEQASVGTPAMAHPLLTVLALSVVYLPARLVRRRRPRPRS